MPRRCRLLVCLASAIAAWAGPVDFGKQEFERALAERKIAPQRYQIQTEVSTDAPESFRILPGRVTGGDIRGLMYGLLEAADQMRARGWLIAAKGSPAMAIRGVRLWLRAADLAKDWFGSREHWEQYFALLARSRINRLNLAFDPGAIVNERVLSALRIVSQAASGYGVDLAVTILPNAVPGVTSGLKALLASCPAVRSVRTESDAHGAVAAASEAGRRVTVELASEDLSPSVEVEVARVGVPLRIPVKYGTTVFETRPEGAEMLWEITGEIGQAADTGSVRKIIQDMVRPGFSGFEVDAPEPPGSEPERPFYMVWGRLGYDPKPPAATGLPKPAKKP